MPGATQQEAAVGPWTSLDEHVNAAIRRRLVADPLKGPEYVATRYLGHQPWAWLKRFDDALTKPMPAGRIIRIIQAPVDQGKSMRLQAHVLRRILLQRDVRIGYGMWTGDLAVARTGAIRRALLNRSTAIRDFWHPTHGPFFRNQSEAGSEGRFRVRGADDNNPTPTLSAIGLKENFEGEKYHVLVFDDAQNRNAMTSHADRELAWRVITSTALGRMEPGGEIWMVGAPWHERDLFNRSIVELADAVGVSVVFDSIQEEVGFHPEGSPYAGRPRFRPLCPERFGEWGEGLLAKGFGTTMFTLKFRCNAKAAAGGALKPPEFVGIQDIRKGGALGQVEALSMGFDANDSLAEDADYTVVSSLGRTQSGAVVVLRLARKHMKTGWQRLIADEHDALRSQYPGIRFHGVQMEDTTFQDEIRMNLHRERSDIHAYPVPRLTNKVVRLSTRLEPWFNAPGRFYILEGIAHGFDMRDEARMFPEGTFDTLDATEAALQPWDSLKTDTVSAVLDL